MNKFAFLKYLLLINFLILLGFQAKSEQNSAFFAENYSGIADLIIKQAHSDTLAYHRLEYMCDVFGPRLSGSENLEKTLEWMLSEMKKDGFENVRADEVMVPHWVRNHENCELTHPRKANIPVFAFGGSIATPKGGIEAEVITVDSFEDLHKKKNLVQGKIVVYNFPYEGYGKGFAYRFYGADSAAKYGAVASLMRPLSTNISNNVHTGMMVYSDSVPRIPHGSITPEDAMLFGRLVKYGITPKIRLEFDLDSLPDAVSHNLIGELTGTDYPDEIIAVGGHTDSWDAGTGAQDNAGGCIVTWEAVRLLKNLGLKPKRTIRIVQWTNEENGVRGGYSYRDAHQHEKHVLMFEHDSGIFPPSALRYTGSESMLNTLKIIEPLLQKINPEIQVTKGGGGVDIGPMMRTGVPGMSLGTNDGGKYFYYHHNHSDTPDKVKPKDLNDCIAAIAIALYIYADLPQELINQK
ncbi:MAG: M20/M25/M40 family metallo-hydrolase [Candidatus Kapabacteria bacterium]|nr:M20/M25/M40 family metallo-hydrolase [Ignavibacteriota bacterium]MCW5883993.1 M20/M25/M40 family metallo-hydrolase [Candidatus Kapabacteria bacterium]